MSNLEVGLLLSKHAFNRTEDHKQLLNIAQIIVTIPFWTYLYVNPSFAGQFSAQTTSAIRRLLIRTLLKQDDIMT